MGGFYIRPLCISHMICVILFFMLNLFSLVYRPRTTNLHAGYCSVVDFVVLFIGQHGQATHAQIHQAVAKWRNKPLNSGGQCGLASHLTDRRYGYVGYAYNHSVKWPGHFIMSGTNRTALWYRVRPGVYALNGTGFSRYQSLLA